ncbi:MAG: selenocysteine-specific translation elongation factor [Candidatus Coatesbacteria bacterium]|nr:MAG: selenocysteine-specific translation elongation factor [Candidatus Coatesbacteria bacterium]
MTLPGFSDNFRSMDGTERITPFTIGTAGHVDHGKSALVKALTGYDPDVLPEERERGLTIDLGFTYLDLGDGVGAGFIDVPGHEKFLKTAVAGIAGIDAVLFVVAADEGVMPQTREHLAALGYMGCKRGVVALTKTDLVDDEWQELVTEDLREFFGGTFLEEAPIIAASAVDGRGLDEIRSALRESLTDVPTPSSDGPFRMPIDRVFTLRGFGTVVAGTVVSGKVRVKDELALMPSPKPVRVRGIQTQHTDVQEATVGMRAALNITGADEDEVTRGDEIAAPNYLVPTDRLDVRLTVEPKHVIKHRERVRFHHGAAEIMGLVLLLETSAAEGPGSYLAQVELDGPLVTTRYERYIVRHASDLRLLGGGKILDLYPTRHRRKDWVIEQIKAIEEAEGDYVKLLGALFRRKRGPRVTYSEEELAKELCLPREMARRVIADAVSVGVMVKLGQEYLAAEQLGDLLDICLETVKGKLAQDMMKESVGRNEVLGALKLDIAPEAVGSALDTLVERGELEKTAGGYVPPGYTVKLMPAQIDTLERIEREVKNVLVMDIHELEKRFTGNPEFETMLKYAVSSGRVIDPAEGVLIHPDTADRLANELIEYLKGHDEIRVAEYKDLVGLSRKHATAVLDHFYTTGVTLRTKGSHRLPDTKT